MSATIITFADRQSAQSQPQSETFADRVDKFAERADRMKPPIHKTSDREKRKELWRKAETVLEFYDHLRDMAHSAARAFEWYGVQDAEPFAHFADMDNHWNKLVDKEAAARAQLLLTPAPTAAALARKKALRSSPRMYHVKVDLAAVDKLIERDEAFLAATNRRGGRR